MFKIYEFKDLINDAIVELLDLTISGKAGNGDLYSLTNNISHKNIVHFLQKELLHKSFDAGLYKTLIFGTCKPKENVLKTVLNNPLILSGLETLDFWYVTNGSIIFDYEKINNALYEVFFSFFSKEIKLINNYGLNNIKFIYLNGLSAKSLITYSKENILPLINAKGYQPQINTFLRDANDIFYNEYKIKKIPKCDHEFLQRQIFD